MRYLPLILLLIILTGCTDMEQKPKKEYDIKDYEVATFAGGCFWCTEAAFEGSEGVIDVYSGYTGGDKVDPTYEEVTTGTTGHHEAIQIVYDPKIATYETLLDLFWKSIDPTDDEGQFVDRGSQYKTAIFYHTEDQKKAAEKSKKDLDESGTLKKPVVTKILPLKDFYKAEEYHQDYSQKRTVQYKIYEAGSGRKQTLKRIWG